MPTVQLSGLQKGPPRNYLIRNKNKLRNITTSIKKELKMAVTSSYQCDHLGEHSSEKNYSNPQNYPHPDNHTVPTTDTPGFKPVTLSLLFN